MKLSLRPVTRAELKPVVVDSLGPVRTQVGHPEPAARASKVLRLSRELWMETTEA